MTDQDLCPICRYQHSVAALDSRLGTKGICFECFEHFAEDPAHIYRVEASARKSVDLGELKTIREIARSSTCWHGPEIGYLDLKESFRRFTHQMPAVVTEDDLIAQDLAARLNKVREDIEKEQEARKKRKSWFRSIVDWFRELGQAFDEAVTAGL